MLNYLRTRFLVIVVFFSLCLMMSAVFVYTTYSVPEIGFLLHKENLIMLTALTLLTTIYGIAFFHMFKRFEVSDFSRALIAFPIGFLMGIMTNTFLNLAIMFLSGFAS